ncbi:hypothetical protein SASPL_145437 [Salvia splendens]|uniref:Glutathione S-transferase n=1 Tax=Salvia splendens TaxID=180675 RepID=A0A8X8Z853_SALSN|nr:hypothetical protein SASPL_145437 [Salvia splendens]
MCTHKQKGVDLGECYDRLRCLRTWSSVFSCAIGVVGIGVLANGNCILHYLFRWLRTLSMAQALCDLQAELQHQLPRASNDETGIISSCQSNNIKSFAPETPSGKESKRKPRNCLQKLANKYAKKLGDEESEMKISTALILESPIFVSEETGGDFLGQCKPSTTSVDDSLKSTEVTENDSSSAVGNFPSPRELSKLDENFLAKRCGLSYRAGRVIKLAQGPCKELLGLNNSTRSRKHLWKICTISVPSFLATDAIAEPNKLKLYSYWRSSCSCRVRIALNLKGLDYEYIAVNLLKGEQQSPEFLKLNPLGLVPVLIDGDTVVSDSLAILLAISGGEVSSASVVTPGSGAEGPELPDKLGADEMLSWVQHHIKHGFCALEKLLEKFAGKYATGDEVFLADLYLAPQIDGAVKRFSVDMNEFPLLSKFNEAYKQLPAFQNAMPGKQLDTPPEARD